jgi:hypothetical protein
MVYMAFWQGREARHASPSNRARSNQRPRGSCGVTFAAAAVLLGYGWGRSGTERWGARAGAGRVAP